MKAFLNWSGGKDSALCLYNAKQDGLEVQALVTTISNGRVTMHGVRKELIQKQAEAIGLPIYFIELDSPGLESYEVAIHQMNIQLKKEGFTHALSGDLFLEDLKNYRTGLYSADDLTAVFPLWGISSEKLINEFIHPGFKAVIVVVNGDMMNQKYCGKCLDRPFIDSLPAGVDICGENGEYHSFVFDGPIFSKPIDFAPGIVVTKRYPRPKNEKECFGEAGEDMEFHFLELLP